MTFASHDKQRAPGRRSCVLCGGDIVRKRCVDCKTDECRAKRFKAAMEKGKADSEN